MLVDVALSVGDVEELDVTETDGVVVVVRVPDTLAEADTVTDGVRVRVKVGVLVTDAVAVTVCVCVYVLDGVVDPEYETDLLTVPLTDAVAVTLRVNDMVVVPLAVVDLLDK